MFAILYKVEDKYIKFINNEISLNNKIGELMKDKIWVTNISKNLIKDNNVKHISFFGTSFEEIINYFGYNNLSTQAKFTVVINELEKIVDKIEKENKIRFFHNKISNLNNNIMESYIDLNDDSIIISKTFLSLIEKQNKEFPKLINLKEPVSRNYNVSYSSMYAVLKTIKDCSIPTGSIALSPKNNVKTTPIYRCNVIHKGGISNTEKSVFFKHLLGKDKILTEIDVNTIKDIFDCEIIETIKYDKSIKFRQHKEQADNSFAEEIYSKLMINKLKEINPVVEFFINSIKTKCLYLDVVEINKVKPLNVIAISENRIIIERDFSKPLDLINIKDIININQNLIIK